MNYKYLEDKILDDVKTHIDATYDQHYVGNGDVQTIDYWISLGNGDTTCRDNAIKYLGRYGKKDGYNERDLIKAIHYIVWMIYIGRQGTVAAPSPVINVTAAEEDK